MLKGVFLFFFSKSCAVDVSSYMQESKRPRRPRKSGRKTAGAGGSEVEWGGVDRAKHTSRYLYRYESRRWTYELFLAGIHPVRHPQWRARSQQLRLPVSHLLVQCQLLIRQ